MVLIFVLHCINFYNQGVANLEQLVRQLVRNRASRRAQRVAVLDLAAAGTSRSGDGQRVRGTTWLPADRGAQGTYSTANVPYAYLILGE